MSADPKLVARAMLLMDAGNNRDKTEQRMIDEGHDPDAVLFALKVCLDSETGTHTPSGKRRVQKRRLPEFEVPVNDIRAQLFVITQDDKLDASTKNTRIAEAVIDWLHYRGRFYYDERHRDFASVMYFDVDRRLLLHVQSDEFQAWLAEALAINRAQPAFKFVITACETEGLSERAEGIEPQVFWASTPDAIYVSCNKGEMVKIGPNTMDVVDNGTDGILFPAGATLEEWCLDSNINPFEHCSLFSDMSAEADHGLLLFQLWAMSLFSNQHTKPPLCVSGPVGSGKTRAIVGLFELLGIPPRVMAITKNGEDDFWVNIDRGGLACFDNADTKIPWLADALAAASTGGTREKRKLYTNNTPMVLSARAWVAVTSASPAFASDPGLADRLIVVRLGRRKGETAERELSEEIKEFRDGCLSWICTNLAVALADTEPTPKGLNARHPDFADFAVRIGRAISLPNNTIEALQAAEADKGLFNLENEWIGQAILDLVQEKPFTGTAKELHEALKAIDDSIGGKDSRMSVKSLSKRLTKLWPHLESVLDAKSEKGHGGVKRFSFSPPAGGIGGFQTTVFTKPPIREFNSKKPETVPSKQPKPPQDSFLDDFDDFTNAQTPQE